MTRRAHVAAVVALAGLMLGGCGSPGQGEGRAPVSERPSMEQVIADYDAMRTEVIAALDARLGAKPWGVDADATEFTATACDDDEQDTQRALPVTLSFRGSWDPADWDEVKEVVRTVAREHGFTRETDVTDRETDFEIAGEDDLGGRYVFGTARNTIFSVATGCLVWDGEPAYDPPL